MHATPKATTDTETLLKPLRDFYETAGHTLPEVRFVAAETLPQPYRTLLVHNIDMTSTLQRFHDEALRVRVLDCRENGTRYGREVLLVTRDTNKTVEFGAIEIALDQFPVGAQREILRAELPLGAILQTFRIDFKSAPRAVFEIVSDELMNSALNLPRAQTLYGRSNKLTNSEGRTLAEIVEILPPAEK
jgi:hypothetical protein